METSQKPSEEEIVSLTGDSSSKSSPVVPHVKVKNTAVPLWVRLFTAPACCLVLGVVMSPKFLVLALVYGLTIIQPLYSYLRATEEDQQQIQAQFSATLSLHRSLAIQMALLGICLWIYEKSRLLCSPKNGDDGDESTLVVHRAFTMARHLVIWEHYIPMLPTEPTLQKFVLKHFSWIIVIANGYYAVLHFVAPFGVMARLIVFNKDPKYEYRLGFFIMLFVALLMFVYLPTMPPRLMPSYKLEYIDAQQITISESDAKLLEPFWSIIDTMKQGETLYDKLHKEGGNPYAAMPSMHTGWALWSCLTWLATIETSGNSTTRNDSHIVPPRIQRILAVSHVVFMVFVIVSTGNHFWLDAVAGATCCLFGRVVARRIIGWIFHDNSKLSLPFQRLLHQQSSIGSRGYKTELCEKIRNENTTIVDEENPYEAGKLQRSRSSTDGNSSSNSLTTSDVI